MAVDFKAKQHEFTQYIRNPESNPLPAGVKPERMAMYRELIFNNIDGFLAGNFPVIRQLLPDEQWYALIQDFFAVHRSKTPYFAEIAGEFLDYLQNERNHPEDFPFLLELAHYEWVEMALSIAAESHPANAVQYENLAEARIKLSPLAWPLIYRYPVHLISPDHIPLEPPSHPACLVVYRNRNDEIKFSEINAMTYRLLEITQEKEGAPVQEILTQISGESPHLDPATIETGGMRIIKDLITKEIVIIDSV